MPWKDKYLLLPIAGGFKPQFIPSLSGVATLFSRLTTAASLWVHLLFINLFAARHVFREGMAQRTISLPFFTPDCLCGLSLEM